MGDLQKATKVNFVRVLKDAHLHAIPARRVTLRPGNKQLVQLTQKKSKDPYDSPAFELSVFSFEAQMSHVHDYLWVGNFPVERFNKKNKKVRFRRKC